MPDWIVSGVIRLSLVPGLWIWARANAAEWPDVVPEAVLAAEFWGVPIIKPAMLAQIAVWGAHLMAALLTVGFLTRIVGLCLLAGSAIYAWWIVPEAWPSAAIFAAMAFYLFARGGGALSIDGALAATTR
jgi:putative oxidoreductase